MSSNTQNLGLVKPSSDDFYDINDFNSNADTLDALFNADGTLKVSKGGTGASDASSALAALGGLPKPVNVTSGNVDLNEYIQTGFWYFSTNTSLSHQPASATNGWLLVTRGYSGIAKQYWSRQGSSSNYQQMYVRLAANSTGTLWNDWAKIYTSLDKVAAAITADTLSTARAFRVDLASGDSANFDGSASCVPGVKNTLPIAHGGTGATTAGDALTNLGAAASSHNHAASAITSGKVPINRGGTNATTASGALTNLGAEPAITVKNVTVTTAVQTVTGGPDIKSNDPGVIKKIGKRLEGYINLLSFTSASSAYTHLAEFKSEYKPVVNSPISGFLALTSSPGEYVPFWGYVNTDGDVRMLTVDKNTQYSAAMVFFNFHVG
ncbi:MAG: hypothetical protein IJK23_12270 [Clostridia bacterium]|nr:hypothetical protein [Clostridia bacterium]